MLTRFLICSLWVVFTVTFSSVNSSPLKGEMSSTSRRQRGYMRVNQLTSLWFALYKIFSPVSARGAGLLLCPERQSKQNALMCQRSERSHNHRQSLYKMIFILLFLLTLAVVFSFMLIGDYSISPLCFLGSVLPHLCLEDSLYKTSPLVGAFTKLSQSSFTLRCLTSLPSLCPTVVGRWFLCFG